MAKFSTFKYGDGTKYSGGLYALKKVSTLITQIGKGVLKTIGAEPSVATVPEKSILKSDVKKSILKTKGKKTIL